MIQAELQKKSDEHEKSKNELAACNKKLSQQQNEILKLKTDFEIVKQKNEALEEENRVRKQSEQSSEHNPGESSCRKRKVADPPNDVSPHKKMKSLQSQLQAQKKKVFDLKILTEELEQNLLEFKTSFGLPPHQGNYCSMVATIVTGNFLPVWPHVPKILNSEQLPMKVKLSDQDAKILELGDFSLVGFQFGAPMYKSEKPHQG